MRMSGKQMNLKFDGQNQLQQLVSSGGVEVTRQARATDRSRPRRRANSPRSLTSAGEWSTIDQTGDVRFREGLRAGQAERAHLDRATNTVTLDWLGGPYRCDDAHDGAVGDVHAGFEPAARRRKRADHGVARRGPGAFRTLRRSPRTFPRITWWRTRRAGTPSIPATAGCGRDNR